jgi:6-phosphogluconolactonase (cycloisomerase 2 family)
MLPRFVYSANFDNTIASYTVDAVTGQLRSTGFVLAGTRPNAVAVTPSNAFVYASNFGSGNISGYSTGSSGALTPIPGSPFAGEPDAFAITIHPTGKFLYVANANSKSNNISGYTINTATGGLTAMSGSPFQADFDTRALVIDPTGKFLYAANASSNDVSAYTIDSATGVLTQITGSPFALPGGASVPQSLAIDPAGKFVFVGDTASSDICVFSTNSATGALTVVTGSPFNTGQNAFSLAVHPSGKFIYAATSVGNLTALSIAGSGALTPLGGSPFSVGTSTISVAIEPVGRFLYVADGNGDILMLSINSSTGELTPSRTILGRASPFGIALANGTAPVTYTPKFTYVANSDSNDISAYTTDPESGTLTQIAGSPFKVNGPPASDPQAVSVAVDPTGKFAYVAEFNGNGLTGSLGAFTINPLTGALSLTSGSPFTVGNQARTVVTDPSGRFVYVTTPFSNSIYGFKINRATGNLTAVSGFSSNNATSPWGAAIDPSGRYLCATMQAVEEVICFSIDPVSGSLAQVTLAAAGASAVSVAIDPSGRFVYVASTLIYAYTLSPAGILHPISGSPFTAGSNPGSVAVDPSGRFLYTANHDSNDVSAFAIDQNTGALTNLPGSPFPAGQLPQAVSVDPSGSFVYAADSGAGNGASGFTLDQNSGALTPIFSSPFPTDSVPYFLAIVGTAH